MATDTKPQIATLYMVWHDKPQDVFENNRHDYNMAGACLHLPRDRWYSRLWCPDLAERVQWHKLEVRDMIRAGIDIIIVDWWALPLDSTNATLYGDRVAARSDFYDEFSAIALAGLVQAIKELELEGLKVPRLAPMIESQAYAGSFVGGPTGPNAGGFNWVRDLTMRFYNVVPNRYWARVDGKALWASWWWIGSDDASAPPLLCKHIRDAFKTKYPGEDLYMIVDGEYHATGGSTWNTGMKRNGATDGADAMSSWAVLDEEYRNLVTGEVRSCFPGFDRQHANDASWGVSPRYGTRRFEYQLQQIVQQSALDPNFKVLRCGTWNDFEEGHWICPSEEEGYALTDMIRRYKDEYILPRLLCPVTLTKPTPNWIEQRPNYAGRHHARKRWAIGTLAQSFQMGTRPSPVTFRALSNYAVPGLATAAKEYLSAPITNVVTTIPLYGVSRLSTAGTVYIGDERITYTAKAGNTLTGCTRGADGTTAVSNAASGYSASVRQANEYMEPPIAPPWPDVGSLWNQRNTDRSFRVRWQVADTFAYGLNNQILNLYFWYFDAVWRGYAELSGDVADTDTTIPVDSTSDFPSVGCIKIGDETIRYRSKTATAFTNCVRGCLSSDGLSHNAAVVHSTGDPVYQQLRGGAVLAEALTATSSVIKFSWAAGPGAKYLDPADYLHIDDEIIRIGEITRHTDGTPDSAPILGRAQAGTTATTHAYLAICYPGAPSARTPTGTLVYSRASYEQQYGTTAWWHQHPTLLQPGTSLVWDRKHNSESTLYGASTTLSADISATATTIPVVSTSGLPTAGVVIIDTGTALEYVYHSGLTTTTLTGCVRGFCEYKPAAAHASGATVRRSLWTVQEWALTDANFVSQQDGACDFEVRVDRGPLWMRDAAVRLPYEVSPDPRNHDGRRTTRRQQG